MREQIKDLETRLDEQSFTISQLNQEVDEQKNASAQLRYLSEEAERLLQENQRQLNLKKDELRAQEEKILKLEKKICMFYIQLQKQVKTKYFFLVELQEVNKVIKDDLLVVRSTVQTIDQEKDSLSNQLDLKSEENLHLTQEINAKIRQIEELNMFVADLEAALE